MAVQKDLLKSTVRAEVITGTDIETGEPIHANRTFNNVKSSATPEAIYEVINSLMSLQKHSVREYNVIETSELLDIG